MQSLVAIGQRDSTFFQESKTFRHFNSSPISLKICQTRTYFMTIVCAHFGANSSTEFYCF